MWVPVSPQSGDAGPFEFVAPDVTMTDATIEVEDVGAVGEADIRIGREEWKVGGATSGRPADTAFALASEFVDRQVVPLPTNPSPEYPRPRRA